MKSPLCLAVALLSALGLAAQAPPLQIPAVELGAAWVSVPLPDRPLDVVEHGGALWVCGTNESIARSTDGGRHWQLLARREHGQMLFALTFPDAATIAAFGTEGMRMVSHDDGASWTRGYTEPHRSLIAVQFGSPKDAFAITDQGYGISHDGGAHWKLHDASRTNGIVIRALAVRDAHHVALVRQYPNGDSGWLLTSSDGGDHFEKFKFSEDIGWDTLRTTADGYVAYGFGAPHNDTPVSAVFHDATGWQLAAGPAGGSTQCTAQGCLGNESWIAFDPAGARYWALPFDRDEPLTRAWAVSGDTICRASETLRCRTGRDAYEPPAISRPAVVEQEPKCLHCPDAKYPKTALALERVGQVRLLVMISKAGDTYDPIILSTPSGSLAEAALATIRGWRFRPAMSNGQPQGTGAEIAVNFGY